MTVFLYVKTLAGNLGGPLYSTLDLMRLLEESTEVRLISNSDLPRARERLEELGVDVSKYDSFRNFVSSSEQWDGVSVLHLQHVFDWHTAVMARVATRRGIPVVLSPRGALDEWSLAQNPNRKRLARLAFSRPVWSKAAVLHVTAQREADQLKAILPSSHSMVAPNVVAAAWTSRGTEIETVPSALFISRLHVKKRPDLAIRGIAPLLRERVVSKLTIAGASDEQMMAQLRSIVTSERVEDFVNFVGELDQADCAAAYRSHELLILPTSQENFGRVLFEGLAFGMAVFVTDLVDTWPELQELGATRIEQDPSDIERVVTTHAQKSQEVRAKESVERFTRANAFLEPDRMRSEYLAIYDRAAGQGP